MASIKYIQDKSGNKVYPVTHERAVRDSEGTTLESKLQSLESKTYVVAWDGSSTPTAANIPAGVSVTYNTTTYTGSLAASASTIGKIYLVYNTANTEYDRYITSQSGSSYSWVNIGSAAVTLEVVDNFSSSSSTKALSAGMGKELKEDAYGYDTVVIDETNILPSLNSGWMISSGGSDLTATALSFSSNENLSYRIYLRQYRGKTLRIKGNASYYTYMFFMTKDLPSSLSGASFQTLIDGGYFASNHFDSGNNFVRQYISNDGLKEFYIPNDAYSLYIAKRTIEDALNRTPQYVYVKSIVHTNGDIDDLQASAQSVSTSIGELDKTVFGESQEVSVEGLMTAKTIAASIDSGYLYRGSSTSTQRAYAIDVEGYKKVTISTNGLNGVQLCIAKSNYDINTTSNTSGSVFASTYKATGCTGYTPASGSDYRMTILNGDSATITLSSNAKWLLIQKHYSNASSPLTPDSVILTKDANIGGIADSSVSASGTLISLSQGYINEYGEWIDSSHFVMTSAIPMSRVFAIEVHSPYRIHGAMLFDNNGKLVNSREYYNSITDSPNAGVTRYGRAMILPQFNVRLRIGTSVASGDVSVTDNIISKFTFLDDTRLHKMVPTDQGAASVFAIAKRRANSLLNVVWTALRNVTITKSVDNYGRMGQVMHGIPYSEAAEYTKYVGQHISVRTFLTAALNKRSVVYTEDINSAIPATRYGISYHGLSDLSGAYYGTVCSGLTCFIEDLANIEVSGTQLNCTVIAGGDDSSEANYYPLVDGVDPFDLIEPLDLIWYTGHITIVTDVYLDEEGKKKFIVWTEQTTPRTVSQPYSREKFRERIVSTMQSSSRHEWKIYRYTKWGDGLDEPEDCPYVQKDFYDYTPEEAPSIDPDITTFAGEYAAFSIGDAANTVNNNRLILNIHRGGDSGYTHLQIFNESDDAASATPVAELGILSTDDYVSQSNIYGVDAATKEDWIKFNLAAYWYASQPATTGKFKARVVRKESSSVVSYSGCTHFEMVDITFSVTRHSSTIDCTFSSTEGNCYLIRQEKPDGMANNTYAIKASDNGSKTLSWSSFGTYNYVKLFVRADYGVVVKRIDASALDIV